MIEFKQIIGRGTRLNEDKSHFNIIDFVGAYKNFLDPDSGVKTVSHHQNLEPLRNSLFHFQILMRCPVSHWGKQYILQMN